MKLCIIGLGYIGLPTAAMFADSGHEVVGVDVNPRVIDALNKGEIIIEEPGLLELVASVVKKGALRASVSPETADVFVICVPTPINKDHSADLTYVESGIRCLLPYIKKGDTVILESTSPPGTTRDFMCGILKEAGLDAQEDLYVAYCPERVLPGKIIQELRENNRVVGGVTPEASERVRDLYKSFVKGDIYIADATTAEMCKLMENTFRDVNIALANELAKLCEKMGVNAWQVIEFANKHPRVKLHQPGPGVGGHCIAVDPWFIVEKQPQTAQIIHLSRNVNDSMPHYVVDKIKTLTAGVEGKKRIALLGVTYKPDVDDMRESPVVEIVHLLKDQGDFEVIVSDKHVDFEGSRSLSPEDAAKGCHLLVLGVNHKEFKDLDFNRIKENMAQPQVLDTRNFWNAAAIEAAGLSYHLLGWGRNRA